MTLLTIPHSSAAGVEAEANESFNIPCKPKLQIPAAANQQYGQSKTKRLYF